MDFVCRDLCFSAIGAVVTLPACNETNQVMEVDATPPGSIVLPMSQLSPSPPVLHVELFAGGFAGWKRAQTMLAFHAACTIRSSFAVEIDEQTANVYAANNPCHRIGPDPGSFRPCEVAARCKRGQDVLYNGEVQDKAWLLCIPDTTMQIWSVSAPCGPWSRGGKREGLACAAGRLFVETAVQARWLRPHAIAAENVDGFEDHPHHDTVLRAFRWAGYQLHWKSLSDMRSVSPCTKKRWLCVWVRDDLLPDWSRLRQIPFWGSNVSLTLERNLTLDSELLDIYSDPLFLPGPKTRAAVEMSRASVLKKRVKSKCGPVGTMTASYGIQHQLDSEMLASKGIYAQLIQGNFGPRFLAPFEIAALMCVNTRFTVPKNPRIGHKVVGNAIAVPQAALALAMACRAVIPGCNIDPQHCALACVCDRLHSANAWILEDAACYTLHQKVAPRCVANPKPARKRARVVVSEHASASSGMSELDQVPGPPTCCQRDAPREHVGPVGHQPNHWTKAAGAERASHVWW